MSTVQLYLLRHAKTQGKPALNGHTDVAVDAMRQQRLAKALMPLCDEIHTIISSPLQRCQKLATLLHQALSLIHI